MKFKIYTLGCKVNTYESNVMHDALVNAGYIETEDVADIAIINTCTVTNTADHKSLKTIKRAISDNPEAIIVVCGCYSQNKQEKIPGVHIVIGNQGKSKIVDYIKEYQEKQSKIMSIPDIMNTHFETMILNNFNKTRAFVKIQDGCNNFCTYCVIPYTRGNVRSKKREDVLKEVNQLVKMGHKEIVLTGIHTGNYGVEFENYDFAELLKELVTIEGLERIRISSIEITELNDRVLKILEESPILVDHIHIPLQSGSNGVLKRMNRKYDTLYFINKIEKIRQIRPEISITTDVIVGFPGETEEEFLETIDTIKKVNFSKLHVFPYSKRDGTAACLLPNHIDQVTKKKRAHILLEISKQLELEYMEKFIGNTVEVLPEKEQIGHTGNYLLVKLQDEKFIMDQTNFVKLEKVEYPYCIGKLVSVDCKTKK